MVSVTGEEKFCYEIKVRSTVEEYWKPYAWSNSHEGLTELLEKLKLRYRYVIWNSYRSR